MSTNPPGSGPNETLGGTITLAAPDVTVAVDVEHGGRLASLVVGGRERLIGPPEPADGSIRWGCFLMAPWPGRLAGGRLRFRARTYQLERTHGRHAIHGLVHGRPWQITSSSPQALALEIELGQAGWPFGGRVRQRIAVRRGTVELEAEIEADEPMPAALGWHPWFDRGGTDPRITVQSGEILERHRMIPTGRTRPATGRLDLRNGPPLGSRRLDDVYVGAGSPAVVAWPDLQLRLELGAPLSTIVVHTPARGFCVEPQTAWPNALAQAPATAGREGAVELAAGERLTTLLRLRFSPRAGQG